LPKEIQRASQTQSSIGIVLIDVDHFKCINDICGHAFGELALQVLAKVIIQNVRDKDIVGPIGGQEFVIIFPDTSLENTYELAEEIQQKVKNLIIYTEPSQAQITISLGVACFPENGTTGISLMDFADRALYMAKCQRGDNRPDTLDRNQEYSKMSIAIPGEIESILLGHFRDDLETFALLKTIAVESKSEPVASAAIWVIAEYFSHYPETLSFLKTIGYEKIIGSLNAVTLDNYREYSLIRIVIPSETEPILLLKMTCPSTGHLHVLRVPPNMSSAYEAICWVNWGIAPEDLAIET